MSGFGVEWCGGVGCRGLGFGGLGFRGLGFRGLGFRVGLSEVEGSGVPGLRLRVHKDPPIAL